MNAEYVTETLSANLSDRLAVCRAEVIDLRKALDAMTQNRDAWMRAYLEICPAQSGPLSDDSGPIAGYSALRGVDDHQPQKSNSSITGHIQTIAEAGK